MPKSKKISTKKKVSFAPGTKLPAAGANMISDAMLWGTRRRALVALLIALVIAVVGFLVYWKRKDTGTSTKEAAAGINPNSNPIRGLNIQKQAQCANDDNCPDGYFCNSSGYCVPNEMQPRLNATSILGRGRGGEGANVQRVSDEERGQE